MIDITIPKGKAELGERLAELIVPKEKWTHIANPFKGEMECRKCSTPIWNADINGTDCFPTTESNTPCPVPDPIPIDDSDACMGMAVRMFRDVSKQLQPIDMDKYITAVRGDAPSCLDPIEWVLLIAAAPQIPLSQA